MMGPLLDVERGSCEQGKESSKLLHSLDEHRSSRSLRYGREAIMFAIALLLCTAIASVNALVARQDDTHVTPTAKVKNGTYTGYYASAYGTENWLGMPYAQ